MMKIVLNLAEIPVELNLLYPDYLRLYRPYLTQQPPLISIGLSEAELQAALPLYQDCSFPAYVEHMELAKKLSLALLPFRRILFHSMAIAWHDKAWLFTAPPGTGKSTQYFLWKLLYKEELRIINGDKPIVQWCDDGTFQLHPSPWNGKENMGNRISAPIAGIIYLEQADTNEIRRVFTGMAKEIYTQLLYSPSDRSCVLSACRMEDALLRTVPLWLLKNRGDRASAQLCHDTLEETLQ